MALIVRIDVDRPYGRKPVFRKLCSRIASDFYFPRTECLGYLSELKWMLRELNECQARAYAFFRECTLPSPSVCNLLEEGGHEIGLHLENSRSYQTFQAERSVLERHIGRSVTSVSKHGSGLRRLGRTHYAPYEPERYLEWAARSGMTTFFGNFEDPTMLPESPQNLCYFPSAFWLEPSWRDTRAFPTDWLKEHGRKREIVMLVHPENVMASPDLTREFRTLIRELDTHILL